MSRIDNATLVLTLSNNTVNSANSAQVRIYATNYNVLRIMSGMGGKIGNATKSPSKTWASQMTLVKITRWQHNQIAGNSF